MLIGQTVLVNFVFAATFAVNIEGATLDTSDTGVFGWLRADTALISFTGVAIVSTLFGLYGYVWSLNYFSPVFVMNCYLFEPIVSQLFGVML